MTHDPITEADIATDGYGYLRMIAARDSMAKDIAHCEVRIMELQRELERLVTSLRVGKIHHASLERSVALLRAELDKTALPS